MATFVPLVPLPVQFQDAVTSVNMSGAVMTFFLAGTSTPTNLFSDNTGTSIGNSITLNSGGYPESGGNVITLFRDASISLKIILTPLSGNPWTADHLEDGLVILASTSNTKGASLIGVEDSGAFFADADVEAVLQDIGSKYLKTDRADVISANVTFSGADLKMADNLLERPEIKDFSLTSNSISSSAGVLTIDLTTGNDFFTTLTENITTITISNPSPTGKKCSFTLEITQDGAGGAFTVVQPASVIVPGGTAPTISTGNDAVDELVYRTRDAGTTWKLDFSQAYA